MDLAMPGIDGWETLRRVRAQGLAVAATAIVSANAFDKALENDVGIQPRDVQLKPVRVKELLDRLGERLSLAWTAPVAPADPLPVAPSGPPLPAPADVVYPPAASLQGLLNAARSGYVRGITAQLDQIERDHPACQAFVGRARSLTQQFRIDALRDLLQAAG
jgi:CheY-like chemotaxis protein